MYDASACTMHNCIQKQVHTQCIIAYRSARQDGKESGIINLNLTQPTYALPSTRPETGLWFVLLTCPSISQVEFVTGRFFNFKIWKYLQCENLQLGQECSKSQSQLTHKKRYIKVIQPLTSLLVLITKDMQLKQHLTLRL